MQWTRPDFTELQLNMEVTAYVNTEDEPGVVKSHVAQPAGNVVSSEDEPTPLLVS